MQEYDALLVVSFGGPEGPDDVIPFLENVLRGRNVPHERMMEVAEHYQKFGGVSPINAQNRAIIGALRDELEKHGPQLPIYWGNRNWHPLLPDAIQRMSDNGVKRALAFVTSAFSCYSGCRQYREDIERARAAVGEQAPVIDKLRVFYNHPGFVESMVDNVKLAISKLAEEHRESAHVAFTAHSIPLAMADGSLYVSQLEEACRLIAERVGVSDWKLVYQSRSGPPHQPWLEPDIVDYIRERHRTGSLSSIVIAPVGFLSDHMEVLFDLDTEAAEACKELGIPMLRAATAGTSPKFIACIRELIEERNERNPRTPSVRNARTEPRRLSARLLSFRETAGRGTSETKRSVSILRSRRRQIIPTRDQSGSRICCSLTSFRNSRFVARRFGRLTSCSDVSQ